MDQQKLKERIERLETDIEEFRLNAAELEKEIDRLNKPNDYTYSLLDSIVSKLRTTDGDDFYFCDDFRHESSGVDRHCPRCPMAYSKYGVADSECLLIDARLALLEG